MSQGTEAVRLKTGKGVSNRIVSARDVSSRECKVVFERLTCDCSNEVNYLGGLGVFNLEFMMATRLVVTPHADSFTRPVETP